MAANPDDTGWSADQFANFGSVNPAPTPILSTDNVQNFNAPIVGAYTQDKINYILGKVDAPSQYDNWIDQAAQQYNLNPKILKAHLIAESDLNPAASSGQAVGLGQFTPATAASIGIDPNDPKQSIFGTAKYMKQLGGQNKEGFAKYYGSPGHPNSEQYAANMMAVVGHLQQPVFMAVDNPIGLIQKGNINLSVRPVVHNSDGSISTVRSIIITDDNGKAILIPTVIGNKVVSNADAIKHYNKTGEMLGIFDNEKNADLYANQLHNQQASEYLPNNAKESWSSQDFANASAQATPEEIADQRKRAYFAQSKKDLEAQQQAALQQGTVGGALKSFGSDVWEALKGVPSYDVQHAKDFVSGIKAEFSNYQKLHATETATLTPQDVKYANEIGVNIFGLIQNGAGTLNKDGSISFQKYIMPTEAQQDIWDNAVKAAGGDAEKTRSAIEQGMQGNFKDSDLLAAILHKSMIAQGVFLLTHPQWQATKTYETVKAYTQARNILTNHYVPPGQTWEQASSWAKAVTEYAKTSQMSPAAQVKALLHSIATEPDRTVKGFIFGMAMDPELLGSVGAAKLGDTLFGAKAVRAAQKAKLFASGAGVEALDSAKLGQSAAQAAKTAGRLNLARKATNVVAPIVGGAGINAAITSVQQQTDKGFVTPQEQLGAAASGAVIGAGLKGAHFLYGGKGSAAFDGKGRVKPVTSVDEHAKVNPPGEPIPITVPVTDHFNIPATGGVGLHAIHMDENVPNTFTLKDQDGKDVTVPAKEIVARVHESVEYPLMHLTGPMNFDSISDLVNRIRGQGKLTPSILNKLKNGESLFYAEAHKIATWAENNHVQQTYNVDPEVYQAAWKPYIEKAESEGKDNNQNVPSDLDTKPYEEMGVQKEQLGNKGINPDTVRKGVAATGAAALAGAYVYNTQDKKEAAKHLGEAIFVSPFLKAGGKEDLWRAAGMEEAGKTPREIKLATGMEKIPGGDWAYNLSTADILSPRDLKPLHIVSPGRAIQLKDILPDNSTLLKHYPEFSEYRVMLTDRLRPNSGEFDNKNTIRVGDRTSDEQIKSVIVHELQHAIQVKEGWALGGNPSNETRRLQEAMQQEAQTTDDPALKRYLLEQLMDPARLDLEGYYNYQDLAGEGQARAAQDIRNVSQAELDKTPLSDIQTYAKGPNREWMVRRAESEPAASAEVPESQLIEQAKQGDQRALNQLFKDNYNTLVSFSRKISQKTAQVLGNTPEDIAQQTMIKAMQSIDQFQGKSKFSTWLYRIAENVAKDNTQRELDYRLKTTPFSNLKSTGGVREGNYRGEDIPFDPTERPVESEADKISGNIRSPEEDLVNAGLGKELDGIVDNLPKHLKDPILLWATKDMSQADIARELGIGLQDVKNRLFQARKLMYGKLSPETRSLLNKQRGSVDLNFLKKLLKLSLIGGGAVLGSNYFASKDQSKVKGAWLGAITAAMVMGISPKRIKSNLKEIWSNPPHNDVRDFLNNFDAMQAIRQRGITSLAKNIRDLVPNKEDRIALTHALEGTHTGTLSPEQIKALGMLKDFYQSLGIEAYGAGVLEDLKKNYVNHEWVHDKKFNELKDTLYSSLNPKDKHGLQRVIPTYQFGISKGLTPVSLDAADLLQIYGDSINRSLAAAELFHRLKTSPIVNGTDAKGNNISKPMIMRTQGTAKRAAAPENYVPIDHPSLKGYSAHPSIVPSLNFVLNARSNAAWIRGIQTLNTAMKRAEVSISAFHPMSLWMAYLAANPWSDKITAPARNISNMFKSIAGRDTGKQAYLNNVVNDNISLGLKNGLQIDTKERIGDEDVNGTGFYAGLHATRDWMDRNLPMGGLVGDKYIQLNHLMDKVIWENLHTGLKLTTFMNTFEQLKRSWAKELDKNPAAQIPSDNELARMAAEHVNRTFGGLNWRRLADDSTTKIGRTMAMAVANPSARRSLQFLMFAPDWTVSTFRAFADALPGKGSGMKGIFSPKTSGDLARQYILRSSVMYFTMFNAINMAMTGHPIWKNDDPFYLDLSNGEKTPANKHFMEVPRLVWDAAHEGGVPGRWLTGKLGVIPSELADQAWNKQYLSTGPESPPMYKPSPDEGGLDKFAGNLGARVAHVAGRFAPFSLSELTGHGLRGAILQTMGIPIYGTRKPRTAEEWAEYHAKKRAAARKAAKTRERNKNRAMFGGNE